MKPEELSGPGIEATLPKAWVQTCIVHLIRASSRYVNYRDRKKVSAALRPIYIAPNVHEALPELDAFERDWGEHYPPTVAAWRSSGDHVTPFLALPSELRRAVYTINTIEGLHRQVRKAIKTRGHFHDEQAATKLIYLALIKADAKWQKTGPGRQHAQASRSTSETASPANHQQPVAAAHTQFVGHPRRKAPSLTAEPGRPR